MPILIKPLRHKKRSKLKKNANKTKNASDIENYKKQRDDVVQLNNKAKLQTSAILIHCDQLHINRTILYVA